MLLGPPARVVPRVQSSAHKGGARGVAWFHPVDEHIRRGITGSGEVHWDANGL